MTRIYVHILSGAVQLCEPCPPYKGCFEKWVDLNIDT